METYIAYILSRFKFRQDVHLDFNEHVIKALKVFSETTPLTEWFRQDYILTLGRNGPNHLLKEVYLFRLKKYFYTKGLKLIRPLPSQ